MSQVKLTTLDNPYDPFVQFEEWYAFDTAKGYNTCSLLARVVYTSDSLGEADQELAIANGIEDIIKLNPLGIYKKFYKK